MIGPAIETIAAKASIGQCLPRNLLIMITLPTFVSGAGCY
jgi:hypothetical protein